jgi:hypothetical protein
MQSDCLADEVEWGCEIVSLVNMTPGTLLRANIMKNIGAKNQEE